MRILHIIPNLGSGGAEKMLVDLVKEMLKRNISCEIAVLTKSNNFFGSELEELGIPVYYGNTKKVYSFKNIFFLEKLLKENSYDCIHTHLFGAQLFTPIALKLSKKEIPLVTTEHSTHNKRRDNKLFYLLDKWIYNQYQSIVAITKDTKNNLVGYLPNISRDIVVIENGIDIEHYQKISPLNREAIHPDIKKDEILILMVAAMREQKDHETLIRASKLLPPQFRILFIGEGERLDEIKNYAIQYGSSNILFLGSRKDVPEIMKAVDIFVLSSKWEGFGLVIVEAAAAGLPVLGSNVAGLNDVVTSIGGKLFEPFNEIDLADNIMKLVSIKKYLMLDVSKYTIKSTVENYLALYRRIRMDK